MKRLEEPLHKSKFSIELYCGAQMFICSVCKEKFEKQSFDIEQIKCILHCTKNDSNRAKEKEFQAQLCKYIIKHTKGNEIQFRDICFIDNYDIDNTTITQNSLISFYQCHFINPLIVKNSSYKLKFEKCDFKEQWNHVVSEKSLFIKCRFDEYLYENLSEDKTIISNLLFFDCGFNKMSFTGIHFKEKLFKFSSQNEYHKIEALNLINCEFDKDIIFNSEKNSFSITELNFTESTFSGKVKIQFCEIKDANFYNTKFEDLADFYQTRFEKVNFERTDFKKISVFSETKFNCDVNFKYTKFLGKSIFRDTVIKGKLNLRNSIFDDEANFLDITSQKREKNENKEFIGEIKSIYVANRETARVIKNFYDNSNNIIEANRFYALEMAEREKELVIKENWREWLIFKAHEISSNHSQDWLLTILWIFVSTFIFIILRQNTYCSNDMTFLSLVTIGFLWTFTFIFIKCTKLSLKWFLGIIALFLPIFFEVILKDFANLINPFSIMSGKEELTFSTLIYKVIIAYLIYQFIISIRQNTKRK